AGLDSVSAPRDTLRYDDSAERSYARLRGITSLVMLPAAVLLLLRGGLLGKLLGIAGTALGLLCLRRAASPARRPAVDRIDLTDEALLLHMGTVIRELRYSSIESIDADEDALAVRVSLRGGEHVLLPPGYGGLGVAGLAERLRKATVQTTRPDA